MSDDIIQKRRAPGLGRGLSALLGDAGSTQEAAENNATISMTIFWTNLRPPLQRVAFCSRSWCDRPAGVAIASSRASVAGGLRNAPIFIKCL
jgi:hypothetical protein